MTGVVLSVGLVLFLCLLYAILGGAESFASMQSLAATLGARLILWAFIYALFFHLCHGVRHLIWDSGYSFDKQTLNRYAVFELVASLLLTAATFLAF
ncbi:MAG: hypothetical protein Kow0065_25130 [Methylomicrobium sp.]